MGQAGILRAAKKTAQRRVSHPPLVTSLPPKASYFPTTSSFSLALSIRMP